MSEVKNTFANEKGVKFSLRKRRYKSSRNVEDTLAKKIKYIKKNYQLYVFFMLPPLILLIIFKYIPIGGILREHHTHIHTNTYTQP